jgi:hypothetical protein
VVAGAIEARFGGVVLEKCPDQGGQQDGENPPEDLDTAPVDEPDDRASQTAGEQDCAESIGDPASGGAVDLQPQGSHLVRIPR